MDRIILKVDNQVAKAWRDSSEKKRIEVNEAINKILKSAYQNKTDDDFINFIEEVQNKAEQRGLTEDVLNEILNEKD